MELLQLRYFQTVARMESITRAAEFHRIPQSAMSQNISRLEKDLGDIKLFDRRNNRIYLNESGKKFLEAVDNALATLDDGVLMLQNQDNKIVGSVKILVLENERFILQSISEFANQYPQVNFSVTHDYFGAPNFTYDLCVSSYKNYQNMQTFHPLISEKIVLAVHEKNLLAQKEKVFMEDLRDEYFICTSSYTSMYNMTLDICRRAGFEPKISYICDDPYFVRKYISMNLGIALAPSVSWKGRFRNNTILINPCDLSDITTSYLLWDESRYMSPAVIAFRQYLISQAQKINGNLLVK